jgi:hypothetical protein
MEGNDKDKDTGNNKTIVYAIIAACILGIIIIGALVLYGGTSEGFSELYFEDPEELPRIVNAGEDVRFNFTLVSHEETPLTYKYNVTFDDKIIEESDIGLEPGENRTLNITFVAQNSSLIPFDVPRVAAFTAQLNQDGEVQLPLTGSNEAFVTVSLKDAKIPDWNSTEVQRVGSLDDFDLAEPGQVSSLGYTVRKDRYSIEDNGQLKTLSYALNVTEYRYEFKKVAVNVTSENEPALNVGADGTEDQADSQEGKAYEIHFWVIVKERPEMLSRL